MKRKLDEPSMSSVSSVRANEIIDLVFIKDDLKDVFLTNPTFTHQLFPNESIHFLSQPNQARLKLYIMCSDLTQSLIFNQFVTEDDQNRIVTQLAPALPKDFQIFSSESNLKIKRSNLQPCGKCVHRFDVNADTFEVWLTKHSDSSGSSLTLQRAEKLALWFIESADSIDFSDDRWEALFLYQVKKDETSRKSYFFGGYFTLFTFRNRKLYSLIHRIHMYNSHSSLFFSHTAIVGAKLRVCQALIFPHLQGKGIGKQLLQVVYNLAAARKDTTEVTVEDPAPAFQRLRDRVDFHWALDTLKEGKFC